MVMSVIFHPPQADGLPLTSADSRLNTPSPSPFTLLLFYFLNTIVSPSLIGSITFSTRLSAAT